MCFGCKIKKPRAEMIGKHLMQHFVSLLYKSHICEEITQNLYNILVQILTKSQIAPWLLFQRVTLHVSLCECVCV